MNNKDKKLVNPFNQSFDQPDDKDNVHNVPHTNRPMIREDEPKIYNNYESVSIFSMNPTDQPSFKSQLKKEPINNSFGLIHVNGGSYREYPKAKVIRETEIAHVTPGSVMAVESGVATTSQSEVEMMLKSQKNLIQRLDNKQYQNLLQRRSTYTSRRQQDFEDSNSDQEDQVNTQGDGSIKYLGTNGKETVLKPNIRFQNYKSIFQDLLKQSNVITQYSIISMMITYDSTKAIVVQKKDDNEFWISQFSLETYEQTFHERVGGGQKDYIKLKEIEQNAKGDKYAAIYFNDGVWFLRTFGKKNRSETKIARKMININEVLGGLDNFTMANEAFQDPYATCCYIDDDSLFIQVFHNYYKMHYQFIWRVNSNQVLGKIGKFKIDTNLQNFPIKSFYSETRNQVFTFYRQAQVFMINPSQPEKIEIQKISDKCFDQMVLIYGEALVVKSSGTIIFFKQVTDKFLREEKWEQYHSIKVRGLLYYIKGNIRIQVTTDDLIYFYIIDKETFMPDLENLMVNYMKCSQTMFGSKVRYGITFKQNQRNFDIYTRKYMHNLKVNVADSDLEGAKGLSLPSMNIFLVAKVDQIFIYNSDTFQELEKIPIKLLESDSREPNEVIGMSKSKCDQWLAVISGKNLVMDYQAQNQIFIFQAKKQHDKSFKYEQVDRIVVKDKPFFQQVCIQFYFKDFSGEKPIDFIFCKATEIFIMNIQNRSFKTVHMFKDAFLSQPTYYTQNEDQTIHILASVNDGYWYDESTDVEVDLDKFFNIDNIKAIVFDKDEKQFYFLANVKYGKIGFYMTRFAEKDPRDMKNLSIQDTQLDIGDVQMEIIRSYDPILDVYNKELVMAYKTIYINTFNVWVYDLSSQLNKRATLYVHERFHFWESSISGIFLDKNKEFITLSKSGIDILNLGTNQKRAVVDTQGQSKMLHSLAAASFLQMDKQNHIYYHCQDYNNRTISIQQELEKYFDGSLDFVNFFFPVYQIKIYEITLRELMIFQSFYLCKTQHDIRSLVQLQPRPKFFFKAYLEFDVIPFVSILAFDSGSMEHLLNDGNSQYFDSMYPLFYKNKIPKKGKIVKNYYYRNAIDNAIRNNQIRSAQLIINYIVKYQNNYISTPLFYNRLPILIEKGVSITNLLKSDVFVYNLDFQDWPQTHPNDMECARPYLGNIFELRNTYKEIFPGQEFAPMEDISNAKIIHKIKYQVNLLPFQGSYFAKEDSDEELRLNKLDSNFMDQLASSEELEIFNTSALKQVIDYKWDNFGQKHHMTGLGMHLFYVLLYIAFVNLIYMREHNDQEHLVCTAILALGIIYPAVYDMIQLYIEGAGSYFQDIWNWVDVLYYITSSYNIFAQLGHGVKSPVTIVCNFFIVILLIVKTFFFLRIFRNYTPIVIMLKNVIYDLRIFLLFYSILIFMFSLLFSVLGVGLETVQDDLIAQAAINNAIRRRLKGFDRSESMTKIELSAHPQCSCLSDYTYNAMRSMKANANGGSGTYTNQVQQIENASSEVESITQYYYLGRFIGQIMATLRLSLGNNDLLSGINDFPQILSMVFWVVWLIVVIVSNIVFLNFIIAEASASYSKVQESLEPIIYKEKINMILEAEKMTRTKKKKKTQYPPFIIIRLRDE